jgi:micrococcal nuclease
LAVEALAAAPLSDSVSELDQGHAGLVTALATLAALKAASKAKDSVHWAAYRTTQVAAMLNRLDSAATAGAAKQTAIDAKKKEIAEAKAAAARQAARRAAEATAAAAAAAEAERIRNLPPAPAPYVPPAPAPYVPPAYVPPAYVPPAPAPAPNPYPGYTGPRCYAPGGKTWTPCSKR